MTTCLETFEKERFCSFPHRHGDATGKTRDLRREMWEHQNEPFVRDFLQFSHFVYSFKIDVFLRVFVRAFKFGVYLKVDVSWEAFRQFSAHLTKCQVCHGICTLSPLDAALPMRFVKNTQHDASKVLRLLRKMTMDTSQSAAPATKTATHLLKTSQK